MDNEDSLITSSEHVALSNEEIIDKVEVDYSVEVSNQQKMLFSLVVRMFGGSEGLYNLNIVDLGCGSDEGQADRSGYGNIDYGPGLSRLLHEAGAKVIGVDIGDLSQEKFHGVQADLTHPEALVVIPDDSQDIVICVGLLGEGTSPIMNEALAAAGKSREQLEAEIKEQARRMLRENGVYLFEQELFLKKEGVLKQSSLGEAMRRK